MKKVTFVAILVLLAGLMASSQAYARDEAQDLKKVVKENPQFESGKAAQFFKVLVTDTKTGKDKVKITLPIALAEILAKCAQEDDSHHLKLNRHDLDINLNELFAELKKLGPMMFIEVYEEDEMVKIWLE